MKKLNIPFIGILLLFLAFTSCEYDGIDPITAVDPGPDGSDPQVTVLFPTEGSRIQDLELVSTIVIKMEVVDDIEIASISVAVDGTEIGSFNEFLDYRIVKQQLTYDNITAGDHVLTVTATDLVGNSTTELINFSKAPPYSPLFAGEIFYMPFDDNFIELAKILTRRKVKIFNPYRNIHHAIDKATMHLEFITAGINVPYSIIIPPHKERENLVLSINDLAILG